MRYLHRSLMSLAIGACLLAAAWGQAPAGRTSRPAPKAGKAARPAAPVVKAEKEPGYLVPPSLYREARYLPSYRRDPFLNPLAAAKKEKAEDEEVPRGPAPPGIAGMRIAEVKLKGTSVGEDSRTAVFEGIDKRVYFLRKGDRLYDGYVKSIATDSVVLVRESLLRSGKTVTLEVTKHVRTP